MDPCRIGHGSRHLFPAAVGVSIFAVLYFMLLLPSSPHGPNLAANGEHIRRWSAVAADQPQWSSLDAIDVPLHQRPLPQAIDKASHHHLLSTAPHTRSRALALSSFLHRAGDWLNVVPSDYLGLHLHDREFRCCLRCWLGVRLHSSVYSCTECHGMANHFGDHQVGCGGNGDRIARHKTIRDVLFSAAQYAALASTKKALSLVPSSRSRPADILLPHWSHGRLAALDVSVISPLQHLTIAGTASSPGHALRVCVR